MTDEGMRAAGRRRWLRAEITLGNLIGIFWIIVSVLGGVWKVSGQIALSRSDLAELKGTVARIEAVQAKNAIDLAQWQGSVTTLASAVQQVREDAQRSGAQALEVAQAATSDMRDIKASLATEAHQRERDYTELKGIYRLVVEQLAAIARREVGAMPESETRRLR
ncbi:MAG: hypothetical protein KGL39_34005 [Patescibacteria group bacterium]|nr:hypothetical protein [Patescibacteria group bacterium]